jgi:hypothetical protein
MVFNSLLFNYLPSLVELRILSDRNNQFKKGDGWTQVMGIITRSGQKYRENL